MVYLCNHFGQDFIWYFGSQITLDNIIRIQELYNKLNKEKKRVHITTCILTIKTNKEQIDYKKKKFSTKFFDYLTV
jgi:hypothetical protein